LVLKLLSTTSRSGKRAVAVADVSLDHTTEEEDEAGGDGDRDSTAEQYIREEERRMRRGCMLCSTLAALTIQP